MEWSGCDRRDQEKLLGEGEMLFTSAWDAVLVQIEGAYMEKRSRL
jgi:hypothetical protein